MQTDNELLVHIRNGDEGALTALLRKHIDHVHRICFRILKNDADAEDATQQTLINVARTVRDFDGNSAFSTWMYRIAANASLDLIRANARERSRQEAVAGEIPATKNPTEAVIDQLAVRHGLSQLPEEFLVPVVLRDIADLSYQDIAAELQLPIGTVRSRIARGRGQLADLLSGTESGSMPSNESERHD